MSAPVISILNMKGGVGKTTTSAHVMRVLYQRLQKKVLLIDLDAQYNLTQTVITQSKYDMVIEEGKTVMSCFEPLPSQDFFKVKKSDQPPPKAEDVATLLRKIGNGKKARIDLLAGSFELVKYSMIDSASQLKSAGNYFKRFISQARTDYDLIVLDCNPSSSFVTKCALENSTSVLSPVRLDKFSVLGVGLVDQLFNHLGLSPDHMILINGVQRYDPACPVEVELRAHAKFGPKVLVNRLVQSKHLLADPSYTGFATDRGGPYSGVLKTEIGKIVSEISGRVWGI
ncbi:ParA family protein [Sulfitobacter sp. W027]|uniref:ParA family protein n=1 Tax=Sulfitobacter sp. W027 TaxID=2867025 RepID=UPI00220FEA13|nr:ParA family protein [Sulfitobacter sp. W027]UWR33526.1 ParA family protein [Sulfitobacter sp. W027]